MWTIFIIIIIETPPVYMYIRYDVEGIFSCKLQRHSYLKNGSVFRTIIYIYAVHRSEPPSFILPDS